VLTVVLQVLLTGRLMRWLGVGALLAVVPLGHGVGFGALGLFPVLTVLTVFEATRRAGNFALTKPARETLFTVVPREDKYKAKAGIDTFVYRGGDSIGTGIDGLLARLGAPVAAVAIPVGLIGVWLAGWLGRREHELGDRAGGYARAGSSA
jgi:AAA family ATP:ADP antiporter